MRLRAVPALLGTRDPGPALERLLRDLREREARDWAVATPRDRLAATLACHSAVRAGQPLAAGRDGRDRRATCAATRTRRCARTGARRSCASRATSQPLVRPDGLAPAVSAAGAAVGGGVGAERLASAAG